MKIIVIVLKAIFLFIKRRYYLVFIGLFINFVKRTIKKFKRKQLVMPETI